MAYRKVKGALRAERSNLCLLQGLLRRLRLLAMTVSPPLLLSSLRPGFCPVVRRRAIPVFAAIVGLTLIGLVGVRVEGLFAQTPHVDFQSYDGEFREEELEEEDPEQEAAPVLPKHFSTPDSLHFPERLLKEESDIPPAGSFSESVPIEGSSPMSSAPPILPAASTLPPHEQLAIYFVEVGVEALSHDDFELAQENFERALEVAPLQPFGYYFLGRLAFARGDHKVALVFLRRADALLVRGDQTWRGEAARLRGAVYEDMRDYRRAHAAYRQSLQLTPTNLRAASALARLADEEPDARAAFPR